MSSNAENTRPTTAAISCAEGSHRYAIDYFKQDGSHLGPISIEPDFQAAKDWAYFTGMRSGRLPPVTAAAEGSVSPLWCKERGEPYCRGVRVVTTAVGGERVASVEGIAGTEEPVSCEFPKTYFKQLAECGSWEWVEKGELEPAEPYTYYVCAYPIAAEFSEANVAGNGAIESGAFHVDSLPDLIPVTESDLESLRGRATAVSAQSEGDSANDMPVFITQAVIDEACSLATRAGKSETGGVLVGQLHRDSSKPEIFIEVVAQIPAQFAEASGTSFSFTPETWAAADAAIELRGRDELIVGWWHSHPRFCNPECPDERRRACLLASPFFSADDIHLHRVCFSQPYQVALLISDLPDTGATPAVFGWRTGMVSTRGYYAVT
jgi:proteasome lid subunit RPN8/RPN11